MLLPPLMLFMKLGGLRAIARASASLTDNNALKMKNTLTVFGNIKWQHNKQSKIPANMIGGVQLVPLQYGLRASRPCSSRRKYLLISEDDGSIQLMVLMI
ncbi:hypothetical protein LOAG_14673 [Loa loa]|uniref:Secreted protein n=1 Tax=Loa loa TaxID=7209 RepID=A0A1S0THU3_LOALO|nr:hypothetical protein LOAG_14673 [Loa loa]EFO13854.1 hypothetical protein LOAG_14673 [Loa loa]